MRERVDNVDWHSLLDVIALLLSCCEMERDPPPLPPPPTVIDEALSHEGEATNTPSAEHPGTIC